MKKKHKIRDVYTVMSVKEFSSKPLKSSVKKRIQEDVDIFFGKPKVIK